MPRFHHVLALLTIVLLAGCAGAPGSDTGAVPDPRAEYTIEEVSTPPIASYNEPLVVDATISNTGQENGTYYVSAEYTDRIAHQSVELSPGESTTVSLIITEFLPESGEHELAVETPHDSYRTSIPFEHPSPYGKTDLKIFVDADNANRDVSGIVANATGYWEANDEEYLGYPVSYTMVDSRSDADIVIEMDSTDNCDIENRTGELLGCADLLEGSLSAPMTATVEPNLSIPVTNETMIHELGHVHGLTHSDAPTGLMRGTHSTLTTGPGDDATKIHYRTGGEIRSYQRQEVTKALEYFEGHDDLIHGDEFRWEYVSEPEQADLIITHYSETDDPVCFESGGGSCGGAGEYKGQLEIRVENINTRTLPWHIGYGITNLLLTDVPDDLESDTDRHDRSRWP